VVVHPARDIVIAVRASAIAPDAVLAAIRGFLQHDDQGRPNEGGGQAEPDRR
jgi:hypothetical protein